MNFWTKVSEQIDEERLLDRLTCQQFCKWQWNAKRGNPEDTTYHQHLQRCMPYCNFSKRLIEWHKRF